MKNNLIWVIIALVVVGGGAFYGGMVYGKSTATATANTARRNFQGGNFAGGAGGRNGGGAGGSVVNGSIISKTDSTITVSQQAGGSKLVLFSSSTPVRETVDVSASVLQVGKTIIANGTQNSDGSLTAQGIQIRNTSTPAFGGGGRGPGQQQ